MRGGAKLLGAGLAWVALLAGAQAAGAAVSYHGGPVAHSMTGVLVDWGPSVNPSYTNPTTGDPGLLEYYASVSGWARQPGGVLAQYMDSSGANAANAVTYGGEYAITPRNSATTLADSAIQSELVSQIQAGTLPRPAGSGLGTVYLVQFPAGDTECNQSGCDGQRPGFCSYHGHAALPDGTNVLYVVLPDDTSSPMTRTCGATLASHSAYLGREWADTITDPLGTGWSDSSGHEVGDLCGTRTTTLSGWTVPLVWSNLDGSCLAREWSYTVPNASFAIPALGTQGQPVTVDASSSNDGSWNTTSLSYGSSNYGIPAGIAAYQWSWGDGSQSTTATPSASHAYAANGTYQVALTVTGDLGFTGTAAHSVTVTSSGFLPPVVNTTTASTVGYASATLSGTINSRGQPLTYRFLYGTSPAQLTQSTPLASGPAGTTATTVSAALSTLLGSTTYYYELQVVASGQTYTGAVQSFTTSAAPQIPVPVTTAASQVAADGAQLNGVVNPGGPQPVAYDFAYGTSSTALTVTTTSVTRPGGPTPLQATATLSGLSAATTYYYRLEVTFRGHIYSGQVQSFTTPIPPPAVAPAGPTWITNTSATIAATVDPAGFTTTYHFEFGASTAYGQTLPTLRARSSQPETVTASLSGLLPGTTYHYRVIATSAGGTTVSDDSTFTTGAAPLLPPRFALRVTRRIAVGAALRRGLRAQFLCSVACTAYLDVVAAPGRGSLGLPVSVAHARASIAWPGEGSVTLALSPSLRRALRRHRQLQLLATGYAIGTGTLASVPATAPFTLTR